jgi:hypothetical protein
MKLWGAKADKKAAGGDAATGNGPTGNDVPESTQQEGDTDPSRSECNEKNGRTLAAALTARKNAVEVLYSAAEGFHASLLKRKPLPFPLSNAEALQVAMSLDETSEDAALLYPATLSAVSQAAREGAKTLSSNKDRLLPIESLALAMATVSATYKQKSDNEEDLQPINDYASHLSHLAGMHLAMACVQKAFAEDVSSDVLDPLARQQASIESLRAAEKVRHAAEERRVAAEKKRDKVRDRGERRREFEEEARSAGAMYEDAQNDVKMRLAILSETERNGVNSGESIICSYVDAYQRFLESQLSIVRSVQVSLQNFGGSGASKAKRGDLPVGQDRPEPGMRQEHHSTTSSEQHKVLPNKTKRPAVLTCTSTSSSRHSMDGRPASRGSMSDSKKPSKRIGGRSESFSGIAAYPTTDNESAAHNSGSLSKTSKFGSRFATALTRSISTKNVGEMRGDVHGDCDGSRTVSPPLLQKQDSSSSSEGKASNWSSSLLTLKRDQSSKAYKIMIAPDSPHLLVHSPHHERGLSHVREGTDEFADVVNFAAGAPRIPSDMDEAFAVKPLDHFDGYGNDAILTPSKSDNTFLSPPTSALNSQWTGYSVATSDGGDPFGGSSVDPINEKLMTGRSPRISIK